MNAQSIARDMATPSVDLAAFDASVFAIFEQLSPSVQQRCRSLSVLPLKLHFREPVLAIADPTMRTRIRESFSGEFGDQPKFLLASAEAIEAKRPNAAPRLPSAALQTPEVLSEEASGDGSADAPVVRLVNRILGKAIAWHASDVHFEPFETHYHVRVRRDGVLSVVEAPDPSLASAISARIKVMARMDIAERRLPQDGRIRLGISDGRQIDLRVNSLPTLWGEKLVLRILGGGDEARSMDEIGMSASQKQLFEAALEKSQGLVLVTGPTGSGKTGTLYAGLKWLNNSERNILAVEDPVEITLPGVNQVQVNTRIGLTFASVLRAFLRQDPDIIMLGEIRDQETAEIAVRAAQTGHVVLATLHTNSALETPGRLIDMGIPPYLLGSALNLVLAQRLLRKLCSHCARPGDQGLDAVGCDHCLGGYSGRLGVFEMLPVSALVSETISRHRPLEALTHIARDEGLSSLREQGLALVSAGLTSLQEVNRVCQ